MSPLYEYQCQHCQEPPVTVRKPMGHATRPEPCKRCGDPMERIYHEAWVGKFKGRTPHFHTNR